MSEVTDRHANMVAALAKPGMDILAELTARKCDLWHHTTGVVTEAAELLNFEDDENLKEELGDLEFYLCGVRQNLALTRAEVPETSLQHGGASIHEFVVFWAGELMDCVKKVVIYGQDPDLARIVETLFELDVRIESIYKFRGFTREDALDANMTKLAKRYPNFEYTDHRAKERADKEEADKRFGQPHYGH